MITSSCDQETGGWTLVARIHGMSGDFSPTSPLWANEDVISPWDAADLTRTTSMKNPGWFSVPNSAVRVCYSGPRSDCASFTHNRGLTLTQFFGTQFAVEVEEEYTFETLMKKFGKHLDLGHLKTVSVNYQVCQKMLMIPGKPGDWVQSPFPERKGTGNDVLIVSHKCKYLMLTHIEQRGCKTVKSPKP